MASLKRLLFQGYGPKEYTKAGTITLFAGLAGLFVGASMQQFILPHAWPLFVTYWLGALAGYIVNLRIQVWRKNIIPGNAKERKED